MMLSGFLLPISTEPTLTTGLGVVIRYSYRASAAGSSLRFSKPLARYLSFGIGASADRLTPRLI